jgi:peptidoglycan/LPS O-acetylase OafA/YrhL
VNSHYRLGGLGVRIFFVLSGFLITGLLLKERAATGTVSLTRFYVRRTLRIAPAYLCYLLAVAVVVAAGWGTLSSSDAWHALTYTVNYAHTRSHLVDHLWSLAVEEQFYLLWPATVALLSLVGSSRAAVSVVLLAPVVRLVAVTWAPESVQASGSAFEATADSLAVGCLLALWRERLWASELYRRAVLSRWFIPVLFTLGMAAGISVKLGVLVGQTLITIAIALGIDRCVRRPTGLAGRFLNWAPVAAIGVGSYSLYLWQQLVLDANPDSAIAFPLNLVLSGLLAWASYQWIEKTALRFRDSRRH